MSYSPAYTIEAIEDKILAALKASALATACKTVDTYHGEVDELVQELKKLIITLPATFVLFAGSKFTGSGSYDDEMQFSIVFIAKDLRGRDSLRTGMYALLEIAKSTLINNDLGCKDIEPLHPESIAPILVTKEFSVYVFDMKTSFQNP